MAPQKFQHQTRSSTKHKQHIYFSRVSNEKNCPPLTFKENPLTLKPNCLPSISFPMFATLDQLDFHHLLPPIGLDKPSTSSSLVLQLQHAKLERWEHFNFGLGCCCSCFAPREPRECFQPLSPLCWRYFEKENSSFRRWNVLDHLWGTMSLKTCVNVQHWRTHKSRQSSSHWTLRHEAVLQF